MSKKKVTKGQQVALGVAVALIELAAGFWAGLWIVIAVGIGTLAYTLILAVIPKKAK